ncbi:MAG: hypothetical protein AAF585_03575 [Verrucomicrobiota bacterium]
MIVHKENTVVIAPTKAGNPVSEARLVHLVAHLAPHGFPVLLNHTKPTKPTLNQNLLDGFALFRNTQFEYALFCDDDFHPHQQLLEELNRTVMKLPENW